MVGSGDLSWALVVREVGGWTFVAFSLLGLWVWMVLRGVCLFVCNICGLEGISMHGQDRKGFSWDSINDIQQAAIGRNKNSAL